jgi:hypothetical protein
MPQGSPQFNPVFTSGKHIPQVYRRLERLLETYQTLFIL